MRNACVLTTLSILIVFIAGCGSDKRVRTGDRFEVMEDLRETATVKLDQSYSDGISVVIPKGTILKVTYPSSGGSNFFECTPVVVNGNSNFGYIEEFFVPEGTRSKEGYAGFSFSLSAKYLDVKLKRVSD